MARQSRIPEEDEREERIALEIIVDAYSEHERALSWYYYLQDEMLVPFPARCTKVLPSSTLRQGEMVTVFGLAAEDNCESEIMVSIKPVRGVAMVPLEQLLCLAEDFETCEAVLDWRYWKGRGYEF
jgi:hypothetical protein